MNATVHTAAIIAQHRTAQLERENMILATRAERPSSSHDGPTGFAVVTDLFLRFLRFLRPARRVTAVTAH